MIPSEKNPTQKWSYQTASPRFFSLFTEVKEKVFHIMNSYETGVIVEDEGEIIFRVIYSDKTKEERTFYLTDGEIDKCFSLIKQMIPPLEDIPVVVNRGYDDEIE